MDVVFLADGPFILPSLLGGSITLLGFGILVCYGPATLSRTRSVVADSPP